jgi:lipopolysaccharide/colanic/teichoic acid biosynthesis glycosyltransferase
MGDAMADATPKLGGRAALDVEELSRSSVGSVEPSTIAERRVRPRPGAIGARKLVLDSVMLALAAVGAAVSAPFTALPPVHPGGLIGFSLAVIALLAYFGVYRPRFAAHLLDDIRSIVGATAVAAMGMAFVTVLLTDERGAADQAVRAWLFAATCLTAGRGGLQLVQTRRLRRGTAGKPTLIVGAGRVGHLVAKRLRERPEFGLRPVAFLDPDPLKIEDGSDLPVVRAGPRRNPSENGSEPHGNGAAPYELGLTAALEVSAQEHGIRHVIVTFSLSSHESELELMRRCHELGVSVSLVPRLFEGVPDQTRLDRLGGLPLVSVHPSDPRGWQFALKYALDRAVSLVAIIVTAPLMLGAALGVLLSMGRPILFRQPRVGIDGRKFEMLKFRTMKSEGVSRVEPDLPERMLKRDVAPGGVESGDRRTRFGAFLRRTSIDELPQLFNVLRGQMSLIGPRPERPEFAREFNRAVYRYPDRHRVKSGITGWAQIHGLRGKTSLSDRVEWDNYYIENWSPWLDLKIALTTIFVIFSHSHDVE